MKYNFWLLFVIIFSANFLNAQNFKEYQLLSEFKVDLKDYEKKDKISIYEKHGSEENSAGFEDSKCRRVAIFFGEKKIYKLYSYNDNIIECSNCGGDGVGDSFRTISIKDKYFFV